MAKRKAVKQTANQREYAKQIKRIKQFINRAEKRGYRFESDIIPTTPKRITKKTIQKLQELTPTVLYEKSTTIDYETGEIISGTIGRQNERKESAKKSAETRKRKKNISTLGKQTNNQYYPKGSNIIYSNIVEDVIAKLQSTDEPPVFPYNNKLVSKIADLINARRTAKTTLLSLTYSVINTEGKEALAWRLENSVTEVNDALETMMYRASSGDEVRSACLHLASIIKNSPLTMSEVMDLSEQDETYESFEYPS